MPPKPAAQRTVYNGTTVEVMFGDMTTFQSDAIVNAANVNLRGGAGIDGAIHAAAGPGLLAELIARFPGIPAGVVGGAYTTGAHNIQTARHIIHTVGPNYNGVGNDIAAQGLAHQQLHNAYRNSLQEAVNNGDRSIAFPTISTGIYAFPRQEAAFLALRAVRDFLDGAGRGRLDRVVFLIYGEEDLHAYNARFSELFPEQRDDGFDEGGFFQEEEDEDEEDDNDSEDEENEDEEENENEDEEHEHEVVHGAAEGGDDHPSPISLSSPSGDNGDPRHPVPIHSSDSSDHSPPSLEAEEPAAPISIGSDDTHMSYGDKSTSSADSSDEEPAGGNRTPSPPPPAPAPVSSISSDDSVVILPPPAHPASPASPAPPAPPAPPVPAPRPGTCGANGGRTKAGRPCRNAPRVGSLRCRFHQNP